MEFEIEAHTLIEFADAWAGLGHAVQTQVKDLLADANAEVNSNAIRLADDRLRGHCQEIDDAFDTFLDGGDE